MAGMVVLMEACLLYGCLEFLRPLIHLTEPQKAIQQSQRWQHNRRMVFLLAALLVMIAVPVFYLWMLLLQIDVTALGAISLLAKMLALRWVIILFFGWVAIHLVRGRKPIDLIL